MRKIWLVFKREYITRVRTKAFVIGTIVLPVFTIGIFALSIFMASRQSDHTLKIAIVDDVGGLGGSIIRGLNGKLPNGLPAFEVVRTPDVQPDPRPGLRGDVQAGRLDAYLVVPKGAVNGEAAAEFHTQNPGDLNLSGQIERALGDAVIARRLEARGIRDLDVGRLVRSVDLKMIKVSKQGESEEKGQTFLTAIVVATLLYTTLLIYGVATMRSVMEEKTTRIVEMLVASVRPIHLLSGKILGVAAVGLTQYSIWAAMAALFGGYGALMASTVRPGASVPQFHLSATLLVFTVIFFLAGYFLFASLYAAIGAMVSTEQEAQQAQIPVTLIIVAAFILFQVILRNPNSNTSVALSLIPFFSPILMVLRIAIQTPPIWQILLSLAISAAATLGVVQISSRIYRVGILMYGKRPSVVELLRWLRYT